MNTRHDEYASRCTCAHPLFDFRADLSLPLFFDHCVPSVFQDLYHNRGASVHIKPATLAAVRFETIRLCLQQPTMHPVKSKSTWWKECSAVGQARACTIGVRTTSSLSSDCTNNALRVKRRFRHQSTCYDSRTAYSWQQTLGHRCYQP
jgi:hypothetical protein